MKPLIKKPTLLLLLIPFCLFMQGCPPTQTHEETVTIKFSKINTWSEVNSGGDLCTGGTAPDQPGPGQIIMGFFHRYSNDSGCYVNQAYEGAVRFQIDAAPFYKRLVKSATLTMNVNRIQATPEKISCIAKLGLTDIPWWSLPNQGKIHVGDLYNLQSVPNGNPVSVDVTAIVSRWANGTLDNNGFILIGDRPEMSDFDNTGMLTNETCEAFYDNLSLTVTFFQFNTPTLNPSIEVHAVRTQTTTDVTVEGTGFTPNGNVAIFADDLQNRMGSYPLGNVTADSNGKFSFFNRSDCTRQPDSGTIRALDSVSGDNARGYLTVFCD